MLRFSFGAQLNFDLHFSGLVQIEFDRTRRKINPNPKSGLGLELGFKFYVFYAFLCYVTYGPTSLPVNVTMVTCHIEVRVGIRVG